MSEAIGVFLTFTSYGTHLHGADTSSVSRNHRTRIYLDPLDRTLVLNSVLDACARRAWHLFCVHIRTNHVHAILQADVPVNRALTYLKGRATFVLRHIIRIASGSGLSMGALVTFGITPHWRPPWTV